RKQQNRRHPTPGSGNRARRLLRRGGRGCVGVTGRGQGEPSMKQSDEELIRGRIKDLWENTNFSATLFESLVGYAVVAADFDGNVIAYNEGARQVYGYGPEEVFGKHNIEVFFPRDFIEAGYAQQIVDVLLATGR